MALPLPLRIVAALAAPLLAWLSLFCVSLAMWDLPGTTTQQLADGGWLLVVSAVFGAVAVANVRIALGRPGTSWWVLLGLAPAVVSVVSLFTEAV